VTIAFGAIGAKSAGGGTTTVSVAYPSSPGAEDLAIAARVAWLSTATCTDESGWTAGADGTSGTGSSNDSHTTRARIDTQELTGSESGSVTFDQGGTISGCLGVMLRYTKDSSKSWEIQNGGVSADVSHGANRGTGDGSNSVTIKSGDLIVAVVAVDTDAALSPTGLIVNLSGSSTGFGTVTRRTSGAGVTTGNDGNVEVFDVPYTGSEQTGGLRFGFTEAVSQCGPVAWIVLREVTAAPPPQVHPVTRYLHNLGR